MAPTATAGSRRPRSGRARARRWVLPGAPVDAVASLADALDLPPLVALLLARRLDRHGVVDVEGARRFLKPDVTHMHEPDLLPGIAVAAERIAAAVKGKERIAVYGDYDVDGVCGTGVLMGLFQAVGADAVPYLPHRNEGYGFNADAVRGLAADGVRLIVTVDHGSRAFEEIALAKSLGVDVVVTDHHLVGDGPVPPAVAIVNPKAPGCAYPFPWLCGTGVAFKLAWAVARRLSGGARVSDGLRRQLAESLALVAMATIADVVPLVDENRVAVVYGLSLLRRHPSPGIRALMEVARLTGTDPTAEDVAFRLAPRINAAGRLGKADRALELLTTRDPERARVLAREIDGENSERRDIEKRITAEARSRVAMGADGEPPAGIVLSDDGWHIGVVGIVAARIASEFHRPTVVIAMDGATGRGSGRSVPGFQLERALAACGEHLLAHGGHAAAAGLEVAREKVPAFAGAFLDHASRNLSAEERIPSLLLDARAPLGAMDGGLVRALARLGPHGEGNPPPLLLAEGLRVVGVPRVMGRGEDHVAFHVRGEDDAVRRAVLFGGADRLPEITAAAGGGLSLAFRPEINRFRGEEEVELHVRDLKVGVPALE